MGFSAVMTAVRIPEVDRTLPFSTRAERILEHLTRAGAVGKPYVVEEIPCDPGWETFTPRIEEIKPWQGGGLGKQRGGYPDFAVLTIEDALGARSGQEEQEARIEAMWGEAQAQLIARRVASRAKVRAWLEGLPGDALIVAEVWDES